MAGPPNDTPFEWSTQEQALLRALFLDEAGAHLREAGLALETLSRGGALSEARSKDAIDQLFRHLHSLKGAAGSVGFSSIGQRAHDLEELCAELRSGVLAPTPGILERLEEDLATLRAQLEGAHAAPVHAPTATRKPLTPPKDRRRADRRPGHDRRVGDGRNFLVDPDRLDGLLDGVGDLVVLRTRLERRVAELLSVSEDLSRTRGHLRKILVQLSGTDPQGQRQALGTSAGELDGLGDVESELADLAAHLDRSARAAKAEGQLLLNTSKELEAEIRAVRLVPLEALFARIQSALNELTRDWEIEPHLLMTGGAVEVDKSVADRLAEPLLHLLRNSLAHGLESPTERQRRGKSPQGRIQLSAQLEGGLVSLCFEDDGRGLDRPALRAALAARDINPDSDEELWSLAQHLLFEPGFSTRVKADSLAGHGVGLDVVRRTIEGLGGDVTLEEVPDQGLRFRMTVPVGTTITEAMLFKVGGQVYAVPVTNVVEATALRAEDLSSSSGAVVGGLRRGSTQTPLVSLHALFGVEAPPARQASGLVVRHGEKQMVLACDRLIGLRTIVIAPLGPLLGVMPYFSGVTISGSGKAQLVLDLGALIQLTVAGARGPTVRAAGPRTSARKMPVRVLVVDDSRLARETASRALGAAGFQVTTAEDGHEAWEILGERRFDAVVTDIEMPRLDGFGLIARIRRDPTLRALAVVVLSSRTGRLPRMKAKTAGADLILTKGPKKRPLAEAVMALIGARKTGR